MPLTSDVVLEGIRGTLTYQLQFWDSIIWASAMLNRVPYVLSEDFSAGQTVEGVTFLNPFATDFALSPLIQSP